MGQEIDVERFEPADFARYRERLAEETALLERWTAGGAFSQRGAIGGLELETWLVGPDGEPLPINEAFLERLALPDLVPELSKFNVELNVTPQPLAGRGLALLQAELEATWSLCSSTASELDADVVAIGILPTVSARHLTFANMSRMKRYKALNEQVLLARRGRPLRLNITGTEHLDVLQHDVMLEAATTSLQVHLQVTGAQAARQFNAALLACAPLVAASANSPYLFGRDLWEETRIPLFEQSVEVGGFGEAYAGPVKRVGFGSGYAAGSLAPFYRENLEHYPVLLPIVSDDPPGCFAHLRLHNGTIWRWVRPLVGFDADGTPHLRIEQRVMPAGPSLPDMAANLAFALGLQNALAGDPQPPESALGFVEARDNFYRAAKLGLRASLHWIDARTWPAPKLILERMLPLAQEGLAQFGVEPSLARELLGIIDARVAGGQTGAAWQRGWVERHGRDFHALVRAYRERQRGGEPVHLWGL